ncbi:MAG: hypothetical protein HWE39_01305 [Oceanospirillaceae bacterium]|nr:hypothetical protein [Oceanospirillaceae bacterium]
MKFLKTPLMRVMSFLTLCIPLVLVLGLYSGQALAICNAASPAVASMFEDDDGNLAYDGQCVDGGDSDLDWNDFAPVTWITDNFPAPYRTTTSSAEGWFFAGKEDDAVSNSDTAFAGGVKQDDNCPKLKGGKAPNKDDMTRVYLSSKTLDGHTLLNLAWARIPQNSDTASAHVGFEFNKAETNCPDEVLAEREVGDVLFVYDFEGGSDPVVLTLRRWIDENYLTDPKQNGTDNPISFWQDAASPCDVDSNSPPCWGDAIDLTALGFAEAEVNGINNDVLDELAPNGPETLGNIQFGEAGIDLTAAGVFPQNSCQSFGRAFAVSRSSGNSGQAQMKDLVGPGDFVLANCGTVIVRKETLPDENPNSTDFSFATSVITNSGAVPNFTLKDDGVNTIYDVLPDTGLTVSEVDPSGVGYDLTAIDCTAGDVTPTTASVATRTVTFDIGSGQILDCTFTNTARSALAVEKDVLNFCSTENGQFELYLDNVLKDTGGDGASFAEDSLSPGSYDVSEKAASGTSLTSYDTFIDCDDGTSVDNAASVAVSLGAGDDTDCTITNIRRPTIKITKFVNDSSTWDLLIDDGNDGFDYEALAKGNGESTGTPTVLTTIVSSSLPGAGSTDYTGVLYGPVVVAEETADGADLSLHGIGTYTAHWECTNSRGVSSGSGASFSIAELQPGENVECEVSNARSLAPACATPE